MKITQGRMAVITVLILIGGLLLLNGLQLDTLFSIRTVGGGGGGPGGAPAGGAGGGNVTGGGAGQFNSGSPGDSARILPEEIRGSYTAKRISDTFQIPLPVLQTAFGIGTVDITNVRLGELHDLYEPYSKGEGEIGTSSMKLFVALYKGLPYETEEPTYLPQSAVSVLVEKGEVPLTSEQIAYLEAHILVIGK